jgi:four helix bundle protein
MAMKEPQAGMSGSYKDLKVWQKPLDLVTEVYALTRPFPREEVYGITGQMRRAAISVSSNIAEGKGRSSDKEFVVFLCHARGSLLEPETQALIARRLGYLDAAGGKARENHALEVAKILNGLITALRKDRDSTPTDCLPENGRTNDQRKLSADKWKTDD